jgi:hypothetical protein
MQVGPAAAPAHTALDSTTVKTLCPLRPYIVDPKNISPASPQEPSRHPDSSPLKEKQKSRRNGSSRPKVQVLQGVRLHQLQARLGRQVWTNLYGIQASLEELAKRQGLVMFSSYLGLDEQEACVGGWCRVVRCNYRGTGAHAEKVPVAYFSCLIQPSSS